MEWCLSVYVFTIHINFIVMQQRDSVMNVAVRYGMEHNVVTDLFDLSDHFYYQKLQSHSNVHVKPCCIQLCKKKICVLIKQNFRIYS